MKEIFAKGLVLAMSVLYFLLAYQAEPITAGFGYVFGTLLVIAFFMSFAKVKQL
jgi:hypothetical protein